MSGEFPALDRARKRFLQRTRVEIPPTKALDDAKSMLQQLCDAFDKDLQVKYVVPVDAMDKIEMDYTELLEIQTNYR
ncbi:hypothetical protein THRCLA_21844 [Thraustotheca clavata]|uniref:Uncharacterized protein n=1 Tax=Thraustotheca clavata TaxID=74557 RepID=A0A1V9ZNA0_9STRA|nr:hypothetical protein THRCLA_21844 [Thraustotheca clavata]